MPLLPRSMKGVAKWRMIMSDEYDDRDQSSVEEFSPERNEDGSFNEARERALERNARRVYYEGEDCGD